MADRRVVRNRSSPANQAEICRPTQATVPGHPHLPTLRPHRLLQHCLHRLNFISTTLETSDALAGSGSVLAITGSSYTQNSGSTLKLLATSNGVNDSIQLGSGTASLNGELNLIFSGFTPAAGQHYTVIGTTGTVSGTFSSLVLTGAPSLLKGTANYVSGTGEVIDLSNLAYFANLASFTPNQASVATYLNNNAGASGYINQQISLFVNYETQVGDHRQFAQTVMAGVAVSF